jgi:N utilization substance protein A
VKVNVEQLKAAFLGIEEDRQLSPEIVENALKDALTKAYQKHVGLSDAHVRVEIDKGNIHVIPQLEVVEEVTDDEFEISLADAQAVKPDAQIGDMIDEEEADISEFDRVEVVLAKNVMKQKIREAEKQIIYEEYHDKVDEMVSGRIETVEDKFVIVNIGKASAMLRRSQQIPTETYTEGQMINVVITEVNQEGKGAQVLVSRSTPTLVRRLFEKDVPEIYQGVIEIKAIAREPGERCKIAVYSHNENIDPIGACIGPKGQRVQKIIEELHGEKIDIFEWSDNISEFIKNALSPAETIAVFPNENVERGLIVVVPDNQLSLAIGRKGKNARLAVKLTNRKIDIKSVSEMEEQGIDYMALADAMQEEYEQKKAKDLAYRQQEKIDALKNEAQEIQDVEDVDFTYGEEEFEEENPNRNVKTMFEDEQEKKEQDEMEEAARLAKEMRKNKSASDVKEYTSKFEDFADASNKSNEQPAAKPKKKSEPKETAKVEIEVKKPAYDEQMKPIYSEEELEEIEEAEDEENDRWDDDIDYEEFDSYYDD